MLMQPFSLDLYTYSFVTILAGTLDFVVVSHSRSRARMAEIRVENLHKSFGDFTAVQDSTFTVGSGKFFCLLGPSGCGKTTTLRMIAGLELPSSGRILLGGEDVTFRRAARTRHRLRVPALRPLSAHERARQYRFPAQMPGHGAREINARRWSRRPGSCASPSAVE